MLKLNNRGWGLRVMAAFCCIFLLILIITVGRISSINDTLLNDDTNTEKVENNPPKTNPINNNNNTDYLTLEEKVKNATVSYVNTYYTDLLNDETITITIANLIKYKVLESSTVGDINCSGYGKYKMATEVIVTPYIKCGNNYTTNGYDEMFDSK